MGRLLCEVGVQKNVIANEIAPFSGLNLFS
jgi:hypothetical protein